MSENSLLQIDRPVVVVIGGGAAGYFSAIRCAESAPSAKVVLLESSSQTLAKVRISGGGRCNVTHNLFDSRAFASSYPRGAKELLGPFSKFQAHDTVTWFAARGVALKAEADGRMFPVTDQSSTVIDCLERSAAASKVQLEKHSGVVSVTRSGDAFVLKRASQLDLVAHFVVLATGSSRSGHALAASLGHTVTPLAPSLFTFKVRHPLIEGLPGISFPGATVELVCDEKRFSQRGPLLITHWGLSGPAILKLSAFAARELQAAKYRARLFASWIDASAVECDAILATHRSDNLRRLVSSVPPFGLQRRFWERIVSQSGIAASATWGQMSKQKLRVIATFLTATPLEVEGKGEFKDEFVTCGGVKLDEIDFRTMESRVQPGLFFAGEILDVDGITGGFNFQNAWTTGWLAGTSIANTIASRGNVG